MPSEVNDCVTMRGETLVLVLVLELLVMRLQLETIQEASERGRPARMPLLVEACYSQVCDQQNWRRVHYRI